MPRPPIDPRRLDRATYTFAVEVPVRYGDIDTYGHINNTSIVRLCEEGRVRFSHTLRQGLEPAARARFVVADAHYQYLSEIHYPEPVDVRIGVGHVGTTSYTMLCGLFQGERACLVSDVVGVNALDGAPRPLSDAMREALEGYRC